MLRVRSRQAGDGAFRAAHPIRDPRDDRLGRWPFAQAVARIVRGAPDDGPVVIGIEGPWGAGKSSVLEMAASDLARNARNRAVTISAWRTSSQDQFLANLGYALSTSLRRDWQDAWWRIGLARLNRQSLPLLVGVFLPILTVAAISLIPGVRAVVKPMVDAGPEKLATGLGIFGIPLLTFLFSRVSQPLATSFSGLFGRDTDGDRIGSMEKFSFDFDVLAAAQPEGTRFVVLIEDLDRCVPARVTDVLSSIAQVSCHKKSGRLAFLLAYDRGRLLHAIGKDAVAHLKADGMSIEEVERLSADYLNRVVQLELPLPAEERTPQKAARLPAGAWRMPVPFRAALLSSLLVAFGLALVGPGDVSRPSIAWCICIAVAFGADWAQRKVFAVRPDREKLTGWDEAVRWAAPWLPSPERDRNRVLNGARVAMILDPGLSISSWQAISVQALAAKHPESFSVPSIAEAAASGGFESERPFLDVAVAEAIKAMAASGRDVRHFKDAKRLHAIASALKR